MIAYICSKACTPNILKKRKIRGTKRTGFFRVWGRCLARRRGIGLSGFYIISPASTVLHNDFASQAFSIGYHGQQWPGTLQLALYPLSNCMIEPVKKISEDNAHPGCVHMLEIISQS